MVVEDVIQVRELNVGGTFAVAGRTGRPAYFQCNPIVKMGGWINAAKAQLHFGSGGTGEVTGFASAFNSEMYLPNKTTTGGSYTSLEVNLNLQASSVSHANPNMPTSVAHFKVGGDSAAITAWEDEANACLFSIQGLTKGAGSVFDDCTAAAASHALKIIIGNTPYYIMLQVNVDA